MNMKVPNQLSYLGSIKPTYGHFYYLQDGEKFPLPIKKTSLRGLKSSYSEGYSTDKTKTNPHALAQPNIIYADYCMPPVVAEEVFCDFSLRISANTMTPEICHSEEAQAKLTCFVEKYAELGGFSELAKRIAKNILMGTWLFRNKEKQPSIKVTSPSGKSYSVKQSASLSWDINSWKKGDLNTLNKLSGEIANAMINRTIFWQAKISASIPVAPCEEIFPSQLMDTKNRDKQLISIPFDSDRQTAALTPQKIGAGLAMIDDWYAKDAHPIRVTEYGGDKHLGVSLRHPSKKTDFYTLIKMLEAQQSDLDKVQSLQDIPDNIHYLMSVLIKGGLFIAKDENTK